MPISFKEFVFELPSQGVAYNDDKVVLIDGDKVKIRPFMCGDLRHLANSKDPYELYYSLLHQLIREPKDLSLDGLLVSDAIFLIFMARLEGIGRDYLSKYRCQSCGFLGSQEVSLEALTTIFPEDLKNGLVAEGLELEVSGCKLVYHIPRLIDEKQTAVWINTLRNKKKVFNVDYDREYILISQLIDTIDGASLNMEQKFDLVQQFTVDDFRYLGQTITEQDTGIRAKATVSCGACNADNDVFISLSPEFFRSSTKRSK